MTPGEARAHLQTRLEMMDAKPRPNEYPHLNAKDREAIRALLSIELFQVEKVYAIS